MIGRDDRIAGAAPILAPALVVAAVAVFFIPVLNRTAGMLTLAFLTLSPVVLSLAWRDPVSEPRARRATVVTAILVALASGGLGLLANRCAADPIVTAVMSVVVFTGTLLVAVLIGRALARGGGPIIAAVGAGVIGFIGFYSSLVLVGSSVFVLC